MTRGKLILITDEEVLISTEFNGDMYPDGHGADVYKRLKSVQSVPDFEKQVEDFNSKNHKYKKQLIYVESLDWLEQASNFKNVYFDNWFSDWLYFKNISKKDWTFSMKDSRKKKVVKSGEVQAFNFGDMPYTEDQRYLDKNSK